MAEKGKALFAILFGLGLIFTVPPTLERKGRNPKSEIPKRGFNLRYWAFFRVSAFGIRIWASGGEWYYPDTPELVAAVIVTLTRPRPSLYLQWRLWAGVRPGGWIGSAPGGKAGERAAERGFWRVGGAANGGIRAQREEAKS
jgi:hypothetical protein